MMITWGNNMTIVSSADGGLRVTVNEQGTPLDIHIAPHRLRRDPHRLAAEIVHLCREGAAAAGQRRIDRMRTAGVPEEILDRFSALLPGPETPSGRRPEADPGRIPSSPVRSWLHRG